MCLTHGGSNDGCVSLMVVGVSLVVGVSCGLCVIVVVGGAVLVSLLSHGQALGPAISLRHSPVQDGHQTHVGGTSSLGTGLRVGGVNRSS